MLRGVYPEPLRCAQGRSQRKGERAQDDRPPLQKAVGTRQKAVGRKQMAVGRKEKAVSGNQEAFHS